MPYHRALPVTTPNRRAEPMADSITKPSLQPNPTSGHSWQPLLISQQGLKPCPTLTTESSQQHHPVGEHFQLRPHPKGAIADESLQAYPVADSKTVTLPCQETQPVTLPDKKWFRSPASGSSWLQNTASSPSQLWSPVGATLQLLSTSSSLPQLETPIASPTCPQTWPAGLSSTSGWAERWKSFLPKWNCNVWKKRPLMLPKQEGSTCLRTSESKKRYMQVLQWRK